LSKGKQFPETVKDSEKISIKNEEEKAKP